MQTGWQKLYGEPPRGGQRGDHHSVKSWLRRSSQGRRSVPGPRDGRASGWLVWTGGLAAGSRLGWDPGCSGRAYCRGSAAARPAPKVVGFHRGGPMGKPGHYCLPPARLAVSTGCGHHRLPPARLAVGPRPARPVAPASPPSPRISARRPRDIRLRRTHPRRSRVGAGLWKAIQPW